MSVTHHFPYVLWWPINIPGDYVRGSAYQAVGAGFEGYASNFIVKIITVLGWLTGTAKGCFQN